MIYPSEQEIADQLGSICESKRTGVNPRLVRLTSDQFREISGRTQIRDTVYRRVEAILLRRQIYLLRSTDFYLLAPFGTLTMKTHSPRRLPSRKARAAG